MRILAIETSCDETAIAVVEVTEESSGTTFRILGNGLLSQIDVHKEYGGVFPALAKREHAKNLVPLLAASLEEAEMLREDTQTMDDATREAIAKIVEREPGLGAALLAFLQEAEKPALDVIAVTHGPGLEPALWVGVNLAKALSYAWSIPVVGVNHMEGHLLAGLAKGSEREVKIGKPELPLLSLLISGGHTELILMKEWLHYERLGETRDDAVGEAFDKVARMLGLPYPGGPEISRLAEKAREVIHSSEFSLPRPMLDSRDLDFSFSGLKTAVMYLLKERGELNEAQKAQFAREFEDAVADVLYAKTSKALMQSGAKTLVLGGGVAVDKNIRCVFTEKIAADHPDVALYLPERKLTTDNAVMIAIAGYFRAKAGNYVDAASLSADGNLALG